MAAIVRSAARRLAGSALLQRAPAAGALPQPKPAAGAMLQRTQASAPFPARFMSNMTQHARREPPETLSQAMEEIQVRKEELYDLIAKSKTMSRQNRQLLKSLSTQIKPRPNDSQWRKTRALEVFQDVVKSSIPLSGTILAGLAVLELQFIKNARTRKADADAKEEMVAHA